MEKSVVDVDSWPGEDRALGVGLVVGTEVLLQNLLSIFILSQEWQQLLGTPKREGRSTKSVMRT